MAKYCSIQKLFLLIEGNDKGGKQSSELALCVGLQWLWWSYHSPDKFSYHCVNPARFLSVEWTSVFYDWEFHTLRDVERPFSFIECLLFITYSKIKIKKNLFKYKKGLTVLHHGAFYNLFMCLSSPSSNSPQLNPPAFDFLLDCINLAFLAKTYFSKDAHAFKSEIPLFLK